MKRLSIFFVLIFLTSIFGTIVHYHEDGALYDDCLVCISIVNNKTFLTQDIYQAHSDDRIISTVSVDKDFITPYILKRTIFARAPPT